MHQNTGHRLCLPRGDAAVLSAAPSHLHDKLFPSLEVKGKKRMRKALRLALPLWLLSTSAGAIVIRHDQPDASYRISPSAIPALADLPDEGHGTLIAPRWVLTAAHAVNMMQQMPEEHFVTINGKRRAVSRIVVYPDFPQAWVQWKQMFEHIKTTEPDVFARQYSTAMNALHDVALLELAEPVTDVAPLPIDRGHARLGLLAEVYGAGATGTDITGAPDSETHRTQLRHAENRLARTDGVWLRYVFDCGADAPTLSGATAGGDSGGPVTITVGGRTYVAGVTHGLDGTDSEVRHIQQQTKDGSFRMGVCGQRFAAARVSFYASWIDQVMAGN